MCINCISLFDGYLYKSEIISEYWLLQDMATSFDDQMDFGVEIVDYSIGDLQVVDESKSLGGVWVDLSNEELEELLFQCSNSSFKKIHLVLM